MIEGGDKDANRNESKRFEKYGAEGELDPASTFVDDYWCVSADERQ